MILAKNASSKCLAFSSLSRGALLLAATCWLSCAKAAVDNGTPGGGGSGGSRSGGSGGNGANGPSGGSGGPPIDFGGFGGQKVDPNLGDPDAGCNKSTVKFEKQIPIVVVLVDRSTSMSDNRYPQSSQVQADTRWNVLKRTLHDVIMQNASTVKFGLATYTSTADSATCPVMGQVDIAINNFDAIDAYYGPLNTPMMKGETPTAEAIRAVTKTLMNYQDPGPKFILLATDGEPDTCPPASGTSPKCANGTGNCPVPYRPGYPRDPNCGLDETIGAVQEAQKLGIGTFVVGVGDEMDVNTAQLQAVANAGVGNPVYLGDIADQKSQANRLRYTCLVTDDLLVGSYVKEMPSTNAKFYRPTDGASLVKDLTSIIDTTRSCTFTLNGTVQLDLASGGSVKLDGQELSFGDPNGWKMNSTSELQLQGTACTRVQSNAVQQLDITFPCRVFRSNE